MTPKSWRWAGRTRAADRLFELSSENATGALHLNGPGGGTIFLVDGRIDYVESVLTPGVEALLLRPPRTDPAGWAELVPALRRGEVARTEAARTAATRLLRNQSASAVEAEILRRTASADAALAALGPAVPETARTRTRFRPDERHWCPSVRTFAVVDVLAEVDRRKALLARMTLGIRPDRVVRRAPQLPIERVRLTAAQWNVACAADGERAAQDIAWALGHGVFATTMVIHQLARLGVLTADHDGPEPAEQELVPARHALSFLRAATTGLNLP
jgi:hypothetical protein